MDSNMANMKKNPACNRNKPPPVRSAYLCGKLRTHLGVERSGFHPATGMDNTNRYNSITS